MAARKPQNFRHLSIPEADEWLPIGQSLMVLFDAKEGVYVFSKFIWFVLNFNIWVAECDKKMLVTQEKIMAAIEPETFKLLFFIHKS